MSSDIDLFALTAELVDIPSVSFEEAAFVDFIEQRLRALPHLSVERVGDNVVARTNWGHGQRVVLAGHSDTVPVNGNAGARIDGDVLWGLGSTDMKGGLAVMLASAEQHHDVGVDLTYVFYAREEVAAEHSGLGELFAKRPDLLVGDLAILGEPTSAAIEAGCQGSVRGKVTFVGRRSHTARAWMGVNAIHRGAPLLSALSDWEPRKPVIDGCQFYEALLSVGIEGGVAGNVVPDELTVTVVHRFAPDKTTSDAEAFLQEFVEQFMDDEDRFEITDVANAAYPAVTQPLLASMISHFDLNVDAKLGWTDVARFAEAGVPAVNFGPGDASIAHMADERLNKIDLDRAWAALDWMIRSVRPSQ